MLKKGKKMPIIFFFLYVEFKKKKKEKYFNIQEIIHLCCLSFVFYCVCIYFSLATKKH